MTEAASPTLQPIYTLTSSPYISKPHLNNLLSKTQNEVAKPIKPLSQPPEKSQVGGVRKSVKWR